MKSVIRPLYTKEYVTPAQASPQRFYAVDRGENYPVGYRRLFVTRDEEAKYEMRSVANFTNGNNFRGSYGVNTSLSDFLDHLLGKGLSLYEFDTFVEFTEWLAKDTEPVKFKRSTFPGVTIREGSENRFYVMKASKYLHVDGHWENNISSNVSDNPQNYYFDTKEEILRILNKIEP